MSEASLVPAHGMLLPSFRVGLACSVKSFWKHSHRLTQTCMSMVCLNLDEMTIKIKDDTWIQFLALHKLSMVTQEAQKFKVILGSIASWRPPWNIWNPVPNKTNHTQRKSDLAFRSVMSLVADSSRGDQSRESNITKSTSIKFPCRDHEYTCCGNVLRDMVREGFQRARRKGRRPS